MIHVKVDAILKQEVEEIFQGLGITTDDAIRLFYEQVCQHQGLPFSLVPNAETQQAVDEARAHNLTPITLAEISAA